MPPTSRSHRHGDNRRLDLELRWRIFPIPTSRLLLLKPAEPDDAGVATARPVRGPARRSVSRAVAWTRAEGNRWHGLCVRSPGMGGGGRTLSARARG